MRAMDRISKALMPAHGVDRAAWMTGERRDGWDGIKRMERGDEVRPDPIAHLISG